MNLKNGGAIAAIASEGISFSGPNDWLTLGLFDAINPRFFDNILPPFWGFDDWTPFHENTRHWGRFLNMDSSVCSNYLMAI